MWTQDLHNWRRRWFENSHKLIIAIIQFFVKHWRGRMGGGDYAYNLYGLVKFVIMHKRMLGRNAAGWGVREGYPCNHKQRVRNLNPPFNPHPLNVLCTHKKKRRKLMDENVYAHNGYRTRGGPSSPRNMFFRFRIEM